MPDQLRLSGPGLLPTALRGLIKANLIHHLAHTGGRRTLIEIGRSCRISRDLAPVGDGAGSPALRRALLRLCLTPTPELKASSRDFAELEFRAKRPGEALWARVGLGLNYLRLWDGDRYFARALDCFERGLHLHPDWAWGHLLRGEAKRSLLDYRGALADYERALSLDPSWSWAHAFKARVLFQAGTREEDLSCLDQALKLEPACGWMLAWRGEALRRLGRLREAAVDFKKALRRDPLYDQAYCWNAKLLEARGEIRQALESLDRGIAICPDFEKAHRQKVRVLRKLGEVPRALRALNRAASLNHRNNWLGAWTAEGQESSPEALAALEELEAFGAENSGHAWTLAWLGETLVQLGKFDQALSSLDKALSLPLPPSGRAWAFCWKGECLLRSGRARESIPCFNRALRLDPGYARAWAWRGRAKALEGSWRGALADYRKTLAARRVEYSWIYAWKAEAELELGLSGQALKDCDAALALDSRPAVFHYWRAKALLAEGLVEESREELFLSCSAMQTFPWLEVWRAEKDRRDGLFTEALSRLAPIVKRHGRRFPWLYLLRYRAKREASLPGALRDADQAMRLDPDCAWIFGLAPVPAALEPQGSLFQDMEGPVGPHCGPVLAYRGQARLLKGEVGAGLADLRHAARLDCAAWIWAWLGEGQRHAGLPREAVRDLSRAVALDCGYANSYSWRGTAYLQLGQWENAARDLDLAVRRRPTARAWLDRSRLRRRRGDFTGALADLHEAARLNSELSWDKTTPEALQGALAELDLAMARHPEEAWFAAWKAEALIRLGRPAEALPILSDALEKNPGMAWARAWRAEARLLSEGFSSMVEEDIRRGLALDPEYARLHELEAEVRLRRGELSGALAALRLAGSLNPYSSRICLARAKVRLKMGRRGQAKKDIEKALRLCPSFAEASQLLARVESGARVRIFSLLPGGPGKSMEFFLNYSCNAKCAFCFNPPDALPELERGLGFQELAARLCLGYARGYRALKFIGGEATLREDLPRLVALSRRIGFQSVQITTNGLRLADPAYARKLVELGADSFRLSVHGARAEVHDPQVGVPGAFAKVERAVANLKGLGVRLGVNTVLNKRNIADFPETCRHFFEEWGLDDVIAYFMRYQGFAALPANREALKLSFGEAVPRVREAFRLLAADGVAARPALIHFPPCAAPELEPFMLDWTRVPGESGQGQRPEDLVTLPDGSGGLIHEVTNSGKAPVAACASCRHASRCLGVERGYVSLFGEGEFRPLSALEAVKA
ncbi:MAG: tetratricopeptide repeat protein [Elusimicrobia bacterium]|nr:tetratricopeptide repeat protein [Elusimicrobiota bacterium]